MKEEELKNKVIKFLDVLNDFETIDDGLYESVKDAFRANYKLLKDLVLLQQ